MLPLSASQSRLVLGTLAVLLSCAGCKERTPTQAPDASSSSNQNPPPQSTQRDDETDASMVLEDWDGGMEVIPLEMGPTIDLPLVTHLWPLAGPVDFANRYLSAVGVFADLGEPSKAICGGVIISRHLVLTAGHCVCPQQTLSELGGAQTLVDSSRCAKTASVKTLVYKPSEGKDHPASSYGAYQSGTVHPHPDLRVLLDAQGQVVSSHADLALILLDESVDPEFLPIPISDKDVQLDESIVIVGSGYDETARAHDGERHYSRNKVTQVLPSGGGRMRIEQPENHHYKEESGGPCLREGREGMTLVGISSRDLGEGEAFTSTYEYRDWLRGEIQRVEGKKIPKRPK